MYYVSMFIVVLVFYLVFFFFQAEDGIRDLVRSRGLGDVYKRQVQGFVTVKIKGNDGDVEPLLFFQNGQHCLQQLRVISSVEHLSLIHI